MATSSQNTNLSTGTSPVDIAYQAFEYGLPLILVDITKQQSIANGNNVNTFLNRTQFCDSDDHIVVRPNCDTFYSSAFFDLSASPLIMNIPITDTQYYMMPLLDAFTNVLTASTGRSVGSPGTRTGQTQGGQYLLVRDTYPVTEELRKTYKIIECPTDMVWAIGRFQVNNPNPDDYAGYGAAQVIKLQSLLSISPLNGDGTLSSSNYDYPDGAPNDIVSSMMPIADFFNRLNTLLISNPPTAADTKSMELFSTIGVGPNLTFNLSQFDADTQDAMNALPQLITNQLGGHAATLTKTKWSINLNPEMGNYGTNYSLRAGVAYNGLGANLVADAAYYGTYCYGSDEQNLLSCSSGQRYVLKLDPLPPQKAFWSLTMYNKDGYFVSNVMNRYGVGHDAASPLRVVDNGDGTQSAKIYIHYDPNHEDDNNWLPAPATDNFNVMIRIYWPDESVIDENDPSWIPPAIELIN